MQKECEWQNYKLISILAETVFIPCVTICMNVNYITYFWESIDHFKNLI